MMTVAPQVSCLTAMQLTLHASGMCCLSGMVMSFVGQGDVALWLMGLSGLEGCVFLVAGLDPLEFTNMHM